jgi:hypothetical protein
MKGKSREIFRKPTSELIAEVVAIAAVLAIVYFVFVGYDCSSSIDLPDNVTIVGK